MPRTPKTSSSSSATITATSRQTRFSHQLTTSTTKSLLLPSLTINIGQRTLLANTDLHLLVGTRYVLSGRNGIGKSTLLKVLGEKLVGGIEEGLRVLYMPQHELSPVDENVTPWEYVVRADVAAEQGRREVHVLKPALEEGGPEGIVRAVRKVRYERRLGELAEKRKEATVRSGVRGVRARRELKEMEVQVEDERNKLVLLLGSTNTVLIFTGLTQWTQTRGRSGRRSMMLRRCWRIWKRRLRRLAAFFISICETDVVSALNFHCRNPCSKTADLTRSPAHSPRCPTKFPFLRPLPAHPPRVPPLPRNRPPPPRRAYKLPRPPRYPLPGAASLHPPRRPPPHNS